MNANLRKSVLLRVDGLLAGAESLNSFRDWIADITWDVDAEDASTRDLVYSIELLLAEHALGHLTTESLFRQLRDLRHC